MDQKWSQEEQKLEADRARWPKTAHTWSQTTINLPDHVVIDSQLKLLDNHLAHRARLVYNDTCQNLSELFGDAAWKPMMVGWKRKFRKLTIHAKAAHQQLADPLVSEDIRTMGEVQTVIHPANKERQASAARRSRGLKIIEAREKTKRKNKKKKKKKNKKNKNKKKKKKTNKRA